MKEMLTFLSSLRQTYRLYIGEGDLIALKHFIDGYAICLKNTGCLRDPGLYEEFYSFLEGRFHQLDASSLSVYEKIQRCSHSVPEAFSVFFDLLDEFLAGLPEIHC